MLTSVVNIINLNNNMAKAKHIDKIIEAKRTQAAVLVKVCQDSTQPEAIQAQQCARTGRRESQCIE